METHPAHLQGEVRWYHVARSRAGRRILERSIERWLELHHLLNNPGTSTRPRYRAVLQREGQGHFVHCHIEVEAGGQSWVGSRVGVHLQQALADCLAHMTPILIAPVPATA
jgi:hypothetical protein